MNIISALSIRETQSAIEGYGTHVNVEEPAAVAREDHTWWASLKNPPSDKSALSLVFVGRCSLKTNTISRIVP